MVMRSPPGRSWGSVSFLSGTFTQPCLPPTATLTAVPSPGALIVSAPIQEGVALWYIRTSGCVTPVMEACCGEHVWAGPAWDLQTSQGEGSNRQRGWADPAGW